MKNILNRNLENLEIVVWQEGKYFVAQCLNVEVSSFGKTKKEALKNIKEALELYFEEEEPVFSEIKRPEITKLSLNYA